MISETYIPDNWYCSSDVRNTVRINTAATKYMAVKTGSHGGNHDGDGCRFVESQLFFYRADTTVLTVFFRPITILNIY